MTQQLVTTHGCKHTDASVVISSHMHSTGGGSTAQRLRVWKTRLFVELGAKEDTDMCSTAPPTAALHGLPSPVLKPHFLMGLASQPGHQLLGTESRAVTADGTGTERQVHPHPCWHLPTAPPEVCTAGAQEGDPV